MNPAVDHETCCVPTCTAIPATTPMTWSETGRTVLCQRDQRNRRRGVHRAGAGQPPPLRGAARVLRRRADLRRRPGERFGYTRWAMVNLVREYRGREAGRCSPRPANPARRPGSAPAKDRVRGRVIELRREGLSTYEISARLATERHPAEPHQRRRDPRRGRLRAAAAPPRADRRAPARPPSGATPGCPAPRGWTSKPGPPPWRPARPDCCCWSRIWSRWACPSW